MKRTRKIIAVLMCIALLPWTLISAFAEGNTNVLYSMTYDNSGDENERIVEWSTAAYKPSYTSEGYLKLSKTGGWTPATTAAIPEAQTFTVQMTYRHAEVPNSEAHAVAIMFGSKEVVAYRAFPSKSWLGDVVPDGAFPIGNWGDSNVAYGYAMIAPDIMSAMAAQKWITVTLEVKDGSALSVSFDADGAETCRFDYQGMSPEIMTGLNAKDAAFRFNNTTAELYDFRVVDGVDVADLGTPVPGTTVGGGTAPDQPITPPAPTVEQPANAGTVLYSATFDNSGDESVRKGELVGSHTLSIEDTGYLRIGKLGGWKKLELSNTGVQEGTNTFTVQLTYRFLSNTDATGGVSMGFGEYEFAWRHNNDTFAAEHPGSSLFNGSFGTEWYGEMIPADIVTNWMAPEDPLSQFTGVPSTYGEWVTVTLEVENGTPARATFKSGDAQASYQYSGRGNVTGIDACNAWFYFNNVGVDVFDYRIVSGTQLASLGTPDPNAVQAPEKEEPAEDATEETKDDKKDDKTATADTAETVEDTAAETVEEKSGCGASTASVFAVMLVVASGGALSCVKRRKSLE